MNTDFQTRTQGVLKKYFALQQPLAQAINKSHAIDALGPQARGLLLASFGRREIECTLGDAVMERLSHLPLQVHHGVDLLARGKPVEAELLADLALTQEGLKVLDHNLSLASGAKPASLDYKNVKVIKGKLAGGREQGDALTLAEGIACLRHDIIPDLGLLYREAATRYPRAEGELLEEMRAAFHENIATGHATRDMPESLYYHEKPAPARNRVAYLAQNYYNLRPIAPQEWKAAREADRRVSNSQQK